MGFGSFGRIVPILNIKELPMDKYSVFLFTSSSKKWC